MSANDDDRHLSHQPPKRFTVLLRLLAEDDEFAWSELASQVQNGDVPTTFSIQHVRRLSAIRSPDRIQVLCDWYAKIVAEATSESSAYDVPAALLDVVASIDAKAATGELMRIRLTVGEKRRTQISHVILNIRDSGNARRPEALGSRRLLDFLLRATLWTVRSDRDLHEVVCEAIEEIKGECERGEGNAGFWNENQPKTETLCQTVLWPRLRDKLFNYGVTSVEERTVGPNRADFWVELPRQGATPIRVVVELKTARKQYGEKALIEPVESQLWDEYMRPTTTGYGIFLTLWFRDESRYDWPKRWDTADEYYEDLQQKCSQVEQAWGVTISPVVIDCSAPTRTH